MVGPLFVEPIHTQSESFLGRPIASWTC
jgi:hypothetical protein